MRKSFVGKNILDTIDKHTHKRITICILKTTEKLIEPLNYGLNKRL